MILLALLIIGAALMGGFDGSSQTSDASADQNGAVPQEEIPPEIAAVIETYADYINEAATLYGVRVPLIIAVISHESNGDANAIGDGGRAIGLMQMHAPAASDVGVDWETLRGDPRGQILAGTHYLKLQLDRFGGDERQALIAYNQGAGVASNSGDSRYAAGARYANAVLSLA